MLHDTNYEHNADHLFPRGTPVYDNNGDKVGTVAEVDPWNNGLIIQKGLFFPKDTPVPMSAIARSGADGIYLSVSKDDASYGNWSASNTSSASSYADAGAVDTQTPYRADAAQSVGDRDLNVDQQRLDR